MAQRTAEFRPEARDELVEASEYYRARNPTAANRFEEAVHHLVSRITEHPEQFAMLESPVRLALVTGFPYCLPFREVETRIEILGVCHASRRPGYWRDRGQGSDAGGE